MSRIESIQILLTYWVFKIGKKIFLPYKFTVRDFDAALRKT